ncbi:hypothetical protein SAMN04487967_0293 [Natronorubrum sediminis]|uniref:Methyltransferase domain-containing protein n=1 Tax=Natronorubrum sediminis TaxID=640943 RepID=A0A1H6FNH6_9EURY|nr:hypothetical protein [Natronorubrum sediminis]SEH11314.1 hypothetical protein SAMN04487967_0293 [Natronorubrum sediminis]
MTTSFLTYLEAKRTVDDSALDRRVLEQFTNALSNRDGPVRLVELGVGVGAMLSRLIEWDVLPPRVSYRGVDIDSSCIVRARERVPKRLESAGYTVGAPRSVGNETVEDGVPKATSFVATWAPSSDDETATEIEITLEVADAFALEDDADAVIAAALLDIVDLESTLAAIESLLAPGGLCYAPITYDGSTAFTPRDSLDASIEAQYHHHMDEVRPAGGSRAGSALLESVADRPWSLLAAGSGDWVVSPVDGGYPHRERAVVSHVLETMADALAAVPSSDLPEESRLPAEKRRRWFERRHAELEAERLGYVAHNVDVVTRVP